MAKYIVSSAFPEYRKPKLFLNSIVVLICLFSMTCQQSPSDRIGPPTTTITYTDADMKSIENILMHNIAKGNLGTVSAGNNVLTIDVDSRQETLIFELPIDPVIFSIPGFFTELKLNKLRLRDVKVHWVGARQAVRLRMRFYNKRGGVVGYYKAGFVRKDLSLKVKNVVLDIFIIPRVESGKLTFAHLDTELSFYEGNVPFFIKPIFHEQINKTIEKSKKALQAQFDHQALRIDAMLRDLFVPGTRFVELQISEGSATLKLKY